MHVHKECILFSLNDLWKHHKSLASYCERHGLPQHKIDAERQRRQDAFRTLIRKRIEG